MNHRAIFNVRPPRSADARGVFFRAAGCREVERRSAATPGAPRRGVTRASSRPTTTAKHRRNPGD